MKKILSLGAGVQSSCVLLMSCKGVLPKLDAAIFADTGWEPKNVYTHLEWLKGEAERHGIPVHILKGGGNIKDDALNAQVRGKKADGVRWASMPYRTLNPDGTTGMIRRQCTSEYKIMPIEKFLKREILGLKKYARTPKEAVIEQWIGISKDEAQRMKPSRNAWCRHHWPLIYDLDMDRQDCIAWMKKEYPERAIPRSACIACPFHNNTEWRRMRNETPDEFQEAIDFDESIRNCGGMRGQMFVHQSAKPLKDVDLDSMEDKGQLNFFGNECEGMCGV